jgi:HAMP domain-containing protein
LHSTALSRAEIAADRIDERELYASSTPLFRVDGRGASRCSKPAADVGKRRDRAGFHRRLAWTVVLLSLLALGRAVLARRIVRPLQSLAESATKLGRGDFSASIRVGRARDGSAGAHARGHAPPPGRLTADAATSRSGRPGHAGGVVEGVFAVDAESQSCNT